MSPHFREMNPVAPTRPCPRHGMPRKLPPLHTLTAFEMVARFGSFSRAAEELALTHGAISHKIRQLEDYLGLRLFVRLPRNVVLTREGSTFLSEVQSALSTLESASLRATMRRDKRTLRVNVLPPFAGSLLVRKLPEFLDRHPDIDLEIDATARLENRDVADINVFIRYGKGDWPGFENVKLLEVDLYPVCSPTYLQKHPIYEPADLESATLLRHTMEPWEPWLRAANVEFRRSPAGPLFTDARLMLDAAKDAQGVALARSVLAESDVRQGHLVRLFKVAAASPFAYFALFQPGSRTRREIDAFVTWLLEICRDAPLKH